MYAPQGGGKHAGVFVGNMVCLSVPVKKSIGKVGELVHCGLR